MTHAQPAQPPCDTQQGRVEIRVQGRLEPRWGAWFEGMDITAAADGTTLIHGPVVDQAALFGVLQRLRDIALPLISVVHVDPPGGSAHGSAEAADAPPDPSPPRPPHHTSRKE